MPGTPNPEGWCVPRGSIVVHWIGRYSSTVFQLAMFQ